MLPKPYDKWIVKEKCRIESSIKKIYGEDA